MRVAQQIAAILATAAATASASVPTVTVTNGSYYGSYLTAYDQDLFLGVPFAQPPVDALRFVDPQPLNVSWSDPRNATQYSPSCYGYGTSGNLSEDCLTLNVVRPSGISDGEALPVAVWIYGGAFVQGGSNDPRYNLSFIVDQSVQMHQPMIGVSINYRVQGFGFLWGSDVSAAGVANLGLKDQHLALRWIKENIASFGGDPEQVTIWGESAGGASVAHQLVAFGGRDDGLFRGAVMESGCMMDTLLGNASAWDASYRNITDAANCSAAADTLECLREVPAETLAAIFTSSSASFGPVVDGDFMEDSFMALLDSGRFLHVPFLLGQNNDEWTGMNSAVIDTDEEFNAYLLALGRTQEEAAIIAEVYPDIPEIGLPGTLDGRPSASSGYGAQFKRVNAYAGDFYFHAFRRYLAQAWTANNVSSFSYNFNVLTSGTSQFIGATHGKEIAFVFHNVDGDGYDVSPFQDMPESYDRLSTLMARMWVSFVVSQSPDHSDQTHLDWPEYTAQDARLIVLDANVTELGYIEPDTYRAEGIAYIYELYHAMDS